VSDVMAAAALAELKRNKEEMKTGIREGLSKLLEFHNIEELRTLCDELGIKIIAGKPKMKEILISTIEVAENPEEVALRVLRNVWDGIIIEYLRSIGKNLMKCRNNLRGSALDHWKRGTLVLKASESENFQNAFIKKQEWKRKPLLGIFSALDAEMERFIQSLEEKEVQLKTYEKKLRRQPSYESVTEFLRLIEDMRTSEKALRERILTELEKQLNSFEICENSRLELQGQLEVSANKLSWTKQELKVFQILHEAASKEIDERKIQSFQNNVRFMYKQKKQNARIQGLEIELSTVNEALAGTEAELLQSQQRLQSLRKAHFEASSKCKNFAVLAEKLPFVEIERSFYFELAADNASKLASVEFINRNQALVIERLSMEKEDLLSNQIRLQWTKPRRDSLAQRKNRRSSAL